MVRWGPSDIPRHWVCLIRHLFNKIYSGSAAWRTAEVYALLSAILVSNAVCGCLINTAQYLYWAARDIPDNPLERINNVEFLYERQFHPNVGNAVMATSYALLCYLAHNDMKNSVPIMKFITSQRNHLMGWSSTSVRSFYVFFFWISFAWKFGGYYAAEFVIHH